MTTEIGGIDSGFYNIPDDANKARRTTEFWEARLREKARIMALTSNSSEETIYSNLLASYDNFITLLQQGEEVPPEEAAEIIYAGVYVEGVYI